MSTQTGVPARTIEVFGFLKQCAREMRTVNYGEIGRAVGLPAVGVGKCLGYIRDSICRKRGLPWLNAIAVQKYTGYPGDRFLPKGAVLARHDEVAWWRGMVLQVFAFDWNCIEFE
jgi:alkylated DNA nucleotide flippase Atl1